MKTTQESRHFFDLFVEKWNSGSLSAKYYKGISLAQEDPTSRTKYKWSFAKNVDPLELGSLRDSVDTDNNKTFAQIAKRPEARKSSYRDEPPQQSFVGPRGDRRNDNNDNDDGLDEEDRQRLERARAKKDMKEYSRTKEAVMDELLPKATGRDAMIEKKKMKAEYSKRKDDSPEMNEADLMGNNDDFRFRLAREKEVKAKKEAEKNDEYQQKLAAFKAKEDEKLAPLRALAAARFAQQQ